jgi:hypothetical protein
MLQAATRFAAPLLGLALASPAWADTAPARCELTPKAASAPRLDLPCEFSQRQGFIGVTRSDGVRHDFSPAAAAGRYTDEAKRPVRRRVDAGGQVFELPDARLSVRWLQGAATAPTRLPPRAPVASGPFDRTLTLQGITFRVQAANDSSVGQVRITPSGLKLDNTPVVREVDGRVVSADVADLNADGSPELYVVVQSAGSGSYASLLAVSANARKSLSDISLPALDTQAGANRGYQGHDDFAVVEGSLVRRMPIYLPNDNNADTNAQPTGGVRQLQYKLHKGEATWVLRLQRMSEF